MSAARRILARFFLGAGAALATLFALEVGVRVVLSFDGNYFEEALVRPRDFSGRELRLIDLLRPHPDDRVVYELRPGVRGVYLDHEVSTNALGMRDVERILAKAPGTFRIAGLGDSHAFGWGVDRDETFYAVLERKLARHYPQRRFEVWNFGVPGYNTVQEVRAFELRVEEVDPDLVVVNFVDNDMDLPNFLAERPNLWTPAKSYLRELISRRLAAVRGESLLPQQLIGLRPDRRTNRFDLDPERVPARYRPLAGWDNMEAALFRLLDLARSRGIPAVLLLNPDDYEERLRGRTNNVLRRAVRELAWRCEQAGYVVVDPQDRIAGYLRRRRLDSSALWIRPTDSHTNPLRHRLVARTLAQKLTEAGVLAAEATPRDDGS